MEGMNTNNHFPSILKTFLILSVTAFLYLCAIPVVSFLGGRFLVNADEPQPADVVIALGGDSGFDRLEKAAEYYKSGMADALLISDTQVDAYTGQDITVYMRNAARELGIPADDIYITEVAATTTLNEARATRKIMLRNGWTSAIVVTDPFHTYRARAYFRDDFQDHDLAVYMTYTAEHWYRPSTWFLSARGVTITQVEYAKTIWMWLTGK
jgi:uncharacterized SAM-binding protein YcdF (DUF218 family)